MSETSTIVNEPDRASGEAGFTLVEALIAIVVLVFGLMAIANLYAIAGSSNTVANQGTAATTLATEQMELLRSRPFDQLTVGTTTETINVPGVGNVEVTSQVSSVSPQLRFIRVRAQGTGVLARERSRAEFTMFRACTATGCPSP